MTLDTDHMKKVSHQCGFFYEFSFRYFVKMTLDTDHMKNIPHHCGLFYDF